MRSRKIAAIVAIATLAGALLGSVPAGATHNDDDDHSDNVKLLARKPIVIDKDVFAQGSDLAFQGKLIVAGSFQGTGFFKIVPRKSGYIKQVGMHVCEGSQGDVSIWGKYVFVSIDSIASNNDEPNPACNNTKTNRAENSKDKEGIRILDISNLRQPKQVAFVETDCGSHTHAILPDAAKENLYLYINSYPIRDASPVCNQVSHRKYSIIKVPLDDVTKSDVIATPANTPPSIGCHDTTFFPKRNLAIAACLQNTILLDVKDPEKPKILSTIVNDDIQFHHSSSFTWDGKVAIISDETGGAIQGASQGCPGDQESTTGAMWFYNVEDPANPELLGHYSLPRSPGPPDSQPEADYYRCTTHLYNILPTKDGRYIAATSYYNGGISIVDFTDPAAPKEIGYYLQVPGGVRPDTWASYWYNGKIYTNDHLSKLGITVFKMKGLGRRTIDYFSGTYNPQLQDGNFQ